MKKLLSFSGLLTILFFSSLVFIDPPSSVQAATTVTYGATATWGDDQAVIVTAQTTDLAGNYYYAGIYTGTVNFNTVGGTDNKTSAGGNDIFLTKIKSDGTYGYTYTFGGDDSDNVNSLAADSSGNIYLAGSFSTTADFDPTSGTANKTSNGGLDAYLVKISVDESVSYAYAWGGLADDQGYSVAVDSDKNVYVAGSFGGTVDFDPTSGVDNIDTHAYTDAFLLKITSSGAYGYTYTWGNTEVFNSSDEVASAVTVDPSDNVYVVGYYVGTVDFDPTSGTDSKINFSGVQNAFLVKLSSSGAYGYSYIWDGGGDTILAQKVKTDPSGNIFVAGSFVGTNDFDPTGGVDSKISGSGANWLTKLGSDQTYGYTKTWNRNADGINTLSDLVVDSEGSVYLAGYYQIDLDFDPSGATDTQSSAAQNSYVIKLTSGGVYDYGYNYGGSDSGTDYATAYSLNVGCTNKVRLAGGFLGTVDFNPLAGTDNKVSGSGGGSGNGFYTSLQQPATTCPGFSGGTPDPTPSPTPSSSSSSSSSNSSSSSSSAPATPAEERPAQMYDASRAVQGMVTIASVDKMAEALFGSSTKLPPQTFFWINSRTEEDLLLGYSMIHKKISRPGNISRSRVLAIYELDPSNYRTGEHIGTLPVNITLMLPIPTNIQSTLAKQAKSNRGNIVSGVSLYFADTNSGKWKLLNTSLVLAGTKDKVAFVVNKAGLYMLVKK